MAMLVAPDGTQGASLASSWMRAQHPAVGDHVAAAGFIVFAVKIRENHY
jgi:hypothetical protein